MRAARIAYLPAELAFIESRKDMPRRKILEGLVGAFGRDDLNEDHIKNLCSRRGWITRDVRPAIAFSEKEIAFVEARKDLPRKNIHLQFQGEFGRPDVIVEDVTRLCARQGWKTRTKAPAVCWTAKEIAFVEANQTLSRSDLLSAIAERFGRTDLKEENIKSLCSRRGFKTGRTGGFEKGVVPANKGKKCPPGVGGNSAAARKHQFKKGQVPKTYRGAGHERIDPDDGYVWLIVDEVNPHTGAATRPVMKHRYLWEKVNGPIPDEQVLKCLDGDRSNTDPSNWALIHRGVSSRLNAGHHRKTISYEEAPAELKPLILNVAKLKHAVGHRAKRKAA
jgi:hypothetical protein